MPESEQEAIEKAMALLRARRDPEKIREAGLKGAEARRGKPISEEHRARLKQAQLTRRERERQDRAHLPPADTEPRKPRGRPRKAQDGQTPAESA